MSVCFKTNGSPPGVNLAQQKPYPEGPLHLPVFVWDAEFLSTPLQLMVLLGHATWLSSGVLPPAAPMVRLLPLAQALCLCIFLGYLILHFHPQAHQSLLAPGISEYFIPGLLPTLACPRGWGKPLTPGLPLPFSNQVGASLQSLSSVFSLKQCYSLNFSVSKSHIIYLHLRTE